MAELTHVTLVDTGVRDGLGDRMLGFDRSRGEQLQVLRVRPELAAFGPVIEATVKRLLTVSDTHLIALKGVARESANTRPLVLSAHVEGERLDRLLARAQARGIVPDVTVAVYLTNQVLSALGTLERLAGTAHGTLSPARVHLTPRGRLVLGEFMFGPLVEQLQFSHARLWHEFGVAMPEEPVPARCDARADVAQVATMLLAIMLGRPVQPDEYPDQLESLLAEVREIAGIRGGDALADAIGSWLDLALPLPGRLIFDSAAQALDALASMMPSKPGYAGTRADLLAFLKQVAEAEEVDAAAPVSAEPALAAAAVPDVDESEIDLDGEVEEDEEAEEEAGEEEVAAAEADGTIDLVIEEETEETDEDESEQPVIDLSPDVLEDLGKFGIELPGVPSSKKRRKPEAEEPEAPVAAVDEAARLAAEIDSLFSPERPAVEDEPNLRSRREASGRGHGQGGTGARTRAEARARVESGRAAAGRARAGLRGVGRGRSGARTRARADRRRRARAGARARTGRRGRRAGRAPTCAGRRGRAGTGARADGRLRAGARTRASGRRRAGTGANRGHRARTGTRAGAGRRYRARTNRRRRARARVRAGAGAGRRRHTRARTGARARANRRRRARTGAGANRRHRARTGAGANRRHRARAGANRRCPARTAA